MSDRVDPADEGTADDGTDLADLRALAAEVGAEPTRWSSPPAGLWERIAAEAGVPPESATVRPSEPVDEEIDAASEVVPVDRRVGSARRRFVPWIVGVAAAVLVAVGVAVVVSRSSEPDVVATATLERLGDTGEGTAELLDDGGSYRLRVDTADLDPGPDGFLELWVIDSGVTRLVSLGPLRPDGTYDLPVALDPRAFPVVDVSVEPVDGDPTHSGDSLLRGTLEF